MPKLLIVLRAIRPLQWIKNLSLFAAIIFTGHLLEWRYASDSFLVIGGSSFVLDVNWPILTETIKGFFVFCALSSASYIFNDIRDKPLDQKHPQKKHRPIASGELSLPEAKVVFLILSAVGLTGALYLSYGFFLISFLFYIIHIAYTVALKEHSLLDILSIASSFLLRVFAGEVLTGYHIPIWLTFSVIFLSLFIASCKRRSELTTIGKSTRPALEHYRAQLLDFYNSTFATGAIIAYAIFTFQAATPSFNPVVSEFLEFVAPAALGRKWLMVSTLPLIVVGIMRYAQLIYEKELGEAPERLVTSDRFLLTTVALWGFSVVLFIYIL